LWVRIILIFFKYHLYPRQDGRELAVTITIDPRFSGFPGVALGGYVGGILARGRPKAEATLHRPVRPGIPYQAVAKPNGTNDLQNGNDIFAVVREATVDLDLPPPVALSHSKAASEQYIGHRRHLVPNCFNCGPMRAVGDGLRIFPGRVFGSDVVAAPWTPSSSLADPSGWVRSEYIWSALDCPTIWALVLLGRPDTDEKAVTARLAVEHISPIRAEEPQVVVGWKVNESGRTRVAGGAIYSPDGRLLAIAKHTLVTTDWGVPMGLNRWK